MYLFTILQFAIFCMVEVRALPSSGTSLGTDASANKYCRICCIELQARTVGKKCGAHTLCKYAVQQKTGPACKGFIHIQFTQNEKRLMVNAHNKVRNEVASGGVASGHPGPQPQAANMRALEWDEELATIADRWASQCIFGNDICRDVDKFPIGQNVARGTFATDGEEHLLGKWYQEIHNFNKSLINSFSLPTSGERIYTRYSQLVWADTYLIGCARVIFQTHEGAKIKYTEHLVCNYGPTGNIPNQQMYKIGPPCSECHEGTACTNNEFQFLCTADSTDAFDDYLVNENTLNSSYYFYTSITNIYIYVITIVNFVILQIIS